MENVAIVAMNTVNVLLCLGMVVYSIKLLHLFQGGKMQTALNIQVLAVSFFLIASVLRGLTFWGQMLGLENLDTPIRSLGYTCLFASIALAARAWTKLT